MKLYRQKVSSISISPIFDVQFFSISPISFFSLFLFFNLYLMLFILFSLSIDIVFLARRLGTY